jgi:threonine/homoserine/homoserine lactone efflux protein
MIFAMSNTSFFALLAAVAGNLIRRTSASARFDRLLGVILAH